MNNFSRNELLLLVGSVLLTLALAVGLLRWFAPGLLGVPVDLQVVQVSEKIPPFYDNIFRREDYRSREFLLKDPYTRVRAKPLIPVIPENLALGPHDLLGFRNRSIPNIADVVVIGDSQTYGNNAILENNWPSQFARQLGKQRRVYTMATGGWGAVQYLDMFSHAIVFRPRIMVIAFYSGNDPHESMSIAYSAKHWSSLRINKKLDTAAHPPSPSNPLPASQRWRVKFKDGVMTEFTPSLRLVSNDNTYETVKTGYDIMAKVVGRMTQLANLAGIHLVFTVIPTKELVYARKIERDRIKPDAKYSMLVNMEKENIDRLVSKLMQLPKISYVDLVEPLQLAALGSTPLYPENTNGHPVAAGYNVIARAIALATEKRLRKSRDRRHVAALQISPTQIRLVLVRQGDYWIFSSPKMATKNGWQVMRNRQITVPGIKSSEIIRLPLKGVIDSVNRREFGPRRWAK